MIDETQGPEPKKKKKPFGEVIADTTQVSGSMFPTPTKKPFGELLKEKEDQLLPVDETAIAPQAVKPAVNADGMPIINQGAKRLYVGPAQQGNVVTKAARNITAYGANRLADLGDASVNAVISAIPIFIRPLDSAVALYKSAKETGGAISEGFGHLNDAIDRGTALHYLKKDFAEETVWKPLEEMFGRMMDVTLFQPIALALTGNQASTDEELKVDMAKALPDAAALVAGAYFGQAIRERQLIANVGRSSGALAGELATNPSKIMTTEMLKDRIAMLPIEDIHALSKSLPLQVRAAQVVTQIVAEDVAGGVAAGLTAPGTAEEKLNAAFQMTAFGLPFVAGIHGLVHVGGKALSKLPGGEKYGVSEFDRIQEAAGKSLTQVQVRSIMTLPPSERAAALAFFAGKLDPAEILARSVDRGVIVNITPEIRASLGENGYTYFDRGDGKFSVLVDRTKNVDPEAYVDHPENLDRRVVTAEDEAAQKTYREIAASNDELRAEIDRLVASGETELAAQKQKQLDQRNYLIRESTKDPLTGAANRRALDLALPKAEADPNTTILVHDVNKFKGVNDTHGHPAGDEVLKAFVDHVRKVVTDNGMDWRDVFRYGGDEFATLIKDNQNPVLVQKVKAEIDAFRYTVITDKGPPIEVTVSTGSGPNFASADRSMYKIKSGKGDIAPTPFSQTDSFFTEADRAHFRATGFVPQQVVEYNGTKWYVHEIAGNVAKLIDSEGNTVIAPLPKIRRLDTLEVASPDLEVNTVLDAPINEADIPKEPGFRRVATRVTEPVKKVTMGDMLDLDKETLTNKAIDVAKADKNIEVEIFGAEGAEIWRKARKIYDSETIDIQSKRYQDAKKIVDEMEGKLTEEQQKKLYRIGDESYIAPDEYLEAARAAANYGPVELATKTPAQLINSMAHLITTEGTRSIYGKQGIARIYRELLQRQGELPPEALVNDLTTAVANRAGIEIADAIVLVDPAINEAFKIIMNEPDVTPRMGFKAELVKPLDQVDLNARAQKGQPAYNPDPDILNAKPKGRNGINIDFASDFDKAVYMLVRTAEELRLYKPERRMFVEARMMQFAKKVGIPLAELEAHKIKLMDEIAKAQKSLDEQIREIGMEPALPGDMPTTPYIDIDVQPFEGKRSKFIGIKFNKVGKVVNAGDIMDMLTPEEKAIVAENKAAFDEYNKKVAAGVVQELNDNGIIIKMDGTTVRAVGPDGKTIATFDSVDEALAFRSLAAHSENSGKTGLVGDLADGSGKARPPASVGESNGAGNLPPTAGNTPVDGYWDPYGDRVNLVNRLARGFGFIQGKLLKPRLGVLRDFGTQYDVPDIRVAASYFDGEAIRASAESQGFNSRISKMFKAALKIPAERIKLVVGTYIKTFSSADALSNQRGRMFNNAKPTNPYEFEYAGKVAGLAEKAVVGTETPGEAMARTMRLIKGIRQLADRYKTEAAKQDPAYVRQLQEYEQLIQNKASHDLITLFNEIMGKDVSEIDMFQVVGIAEAIINKSVDKATFSINNKMPPHELNVASQMSQFINEVAAKNGLDGAYLIRVMDQIGRLNGGTFEGSIYSYQKGWKPEQLSFLQQLIRDPASIAFERDPFKLMSNLTTTSVRSRILGPAKEAFLERVATELQARQESADFASLQKNDSGKYAGKIRRVNKKIMEVVDRYAEEVVGKVDGYDDIVSDAVNEMLNHIAKRMGSEKEFNISGRKVLSVINRSLESAAQGMRPGAGAVDFVYTTVKLLTEYPPWRVAKMLTITEKAIKNATELQKQGKISGIQIIIPEDMSGPSTTKFGRATKEIFKEGSELGFKVSLQPDVFKFYGAVIYTEAMGRVSQAAKKFGTAATKENMLKVADYLDLEIFPPSIRQEFFKNYLHGGVEVAAEFLARESNNHFQVQYGRGLHPEQFGSIYGRAFGTFGGWPLAAFDSWRQNLANRTYKTMIPWAAATYGVWWLQDKIQEKTGMDLRRYSQTPADWLTWRGGPMVGLAGSIQDYVYAKSVGNEYLAREAEWQLKNFAPNGAPGDLSWLERITPFNAYDPNWSSIAVPFSYGIQDARGALDELNNGDLMQAILRELSIKPMK